MVWKFILKNDWGADMGTLEIQYLLKAMHNTDVLQILSPIASLPIYRLVTHIKDDANAIIGIVSL